MREQILAPHASALSQSMRDLGYSLESAVADLIDNSITAKAKRIQLFFELLGLDDSSLAIIDDGSGMTEDELLEAMRPGSRNPRAKRQIDDLGRFGLGLKTASFSQCKSLTVASRKNGELFAAQWDLDLISNRNQWVVNILPPEMIEQLPFITELKKQGTYVLWQKLDRLLESTLDERGKTNTYEKLSVVEKHLALVFHRYLTGEYKRRKVAIQINGHAIEPFDPFCISNKATQLLPEEVVRIDGHEVKIQPFILPHHSKLSKKEYDFYQSRSDFVSNQGAYVYRNGRLMAWGDWFRLVPKSEATKLARVKIDFSNSLDELWTIDIKKSRAHPPYQVREKLRLIVNRIADQSKRVHRGRGNRLFEEQEQPLWTRFADRGGIRFAINREHPFITSIQNKLGSEYWKAFEEVLLVVESSIPLESIYADYSNTPQAFEEKLEVTYDEMKAKLENLYALLSTAIQVHKDEFARIVYGLKPFSDNKKMTQKIIGELL